MLKRNKPGHSKRQRSRNSRRAHAASMVAAHHDELRHQRAARRSAKQLDQAKRRERIRLAREGPVRPVFELSLAEREAGT